MKLYTQKEVNKILGMMRYHEELLTNHIEQSIPFERYKRFLFRHKLPPFTACDFLEEIIRNAIISNKVVYALQENGLVNLFDIKVDYYSNKPFKCSTQQLFMQLGKLSANIRTSTCSNFLDRRWHEALQGLEITLLSSFMGND